MGTIRVRGFAERRFPAERFTVCMEIRANGTTSGEAITAGKQQTEEMLGRMLEQLQLKPECFMMQNEAVRQIYGEQPRYQYTKSISVEIAADLAAVSQMTAMLETLSDTEYHIDYALSDLAEKEREVLRLAVEDSRRRAELIASAVGQKLCGIEDVQCEYAGCEEMMRDAAVPKCAAAGCVNGLAERLRTPEQTVSKDVQIVWKTE
ncbi:MAG: SIMPL domain-containing protein [Oscillospiraceae bacterium]|nr:SIMPL domain-containing protein [Oscillospiraceae bacterium]